MTLVDKSIESQMPVLSHDVLQAPSHVYDGLKFDGWEDFLANPDMVPITYAAKDLPLGCVMADVVTDLRTKFVEHQGWLKFEPGQFDHDRYDTYEDTQVFAAGITTEKHPDPISGADILEPVSIDACMRLTKVEDALVSLSFEMWGEGLDREFAEAYAQHADTLCAAAKAGKLYDLTRLATEYESKQFNNSDEKMEAMRKAVQNCFLMFGAGVAHTQDLAEYSEGYEGPEAIWIFTINDSVRTLLDVTGISYHVLKQGEISEGDGYTSSLCYLKVKEGLAEVKDVEGFTDARTLVETGITQNLKISR